MSRVVFRVDVLKGQRPDCTDLPDVFTGFRPVEVGSIARQDDHGPGCICLQFIRVGLVSQANIENTRNDWIQPVLRVLCSFGKLARRANQSRTVELKQSDDGIGDTFVSTRYSRPRLIQEQQPTQPRNTKNDGHGPSCEHDADVISAYWLS
jgi:hypothetical protein